MSWNHTDVTTENEETLLVNVDVCSYLNCFVILEPRVSLEAH